MYDMLATPLLYICLTCRGPSCGQGLRSEFSPTDLTLFACPSAESPSVPQCPRRSPPTVRIFSTVKFLIILSLGPSLEAYVSCVTHHHHHHPTYFIVRPPLYLLSPPSRNRKMPKFF